LHFITLMLPRLIIALSILFTPLYSQDVVVDKVKFNSLSRSWVEVEIELTCNGNTSGDSVSGDFLEKIKVKPYLAFSKDSGTNQFIYFTSEIEILIMERRDSNKVYFYLPGLIIERDDLKLPDYYYVELEVNGNPVAPQKSAYDGIGAGSIENFKSQVQAGAEKTKDMLMPVYLAPLEFSSRVQRELPTLLRREAK